MGVLGYKFTFLQKHALATLSATATGVAFVLCMMIATDILNQSTTGSLNPTAYPALLITGTLAGWAVNAVICFPISVLIEWTRKQLNLLHLRHAILGGIFCSWVVGLGVCVSLGASMAFEGSEERRIISSLLTGSQASNVLWILIGMVFFLAVPGAIGGYTFHRLGLPSVPENSFLHQNTPSSFQSSEGTDLQ